MGEANYDLLHPGLTVYHGPGLVVPILAVVIPFYLATWAPFTWLEDRHHLFAALALGAVITGLSWLAMAFVPFLKDDQYRLNKAVLLGLLVSEILVFTYPNAKSFKDRVPSAPIISFFLFMYLFGVSEIYRD
jgi:hypothetical protein